MRKKLDANQMRAMNKYLLFISHRRSEAIYIYYIHIHLSTVDVSCVFVFGDKHLVKYHNLPTYGGSQICIKYLLQNLNVTLQIMACKWLLDLFQIAYPP